MRCFLRKLRQNSEMCFHLHKPHQSHYYILDKESHYKSHLLYDLERTDILDMN